MATVVALVPGKNKEVYGRNGRPLKFKDTAKAVDFLDSLEPGSTLLVPMGGPAQSLWVLAGRKDLTVQRIPWFHLETAIGAKSKDLSPKDKALAIKTAWGTNPDLFYTMGREDPIMHTLRELTRVRGGVQDVRKVAQLKYQAAYRDLEPLLPDEQENLALRTMFANPGLISGAKEDEKELEKRIKQLVRDLEIWQALHPDKNSVLPEVKGLGPALGGAILGEIYKVERFPTSAALRQYARFGMAPDGTMQRRKTGEIASWNRYLNQAVWFWSSDQVARYDHVWRQVYLYYKLLELEAHDGPVIEEIDGKPRTKYTLGHLDKRAKRRVGSKLLQYIFELWTAINAGHDPEKWFVSAIHNPTAPPDALQTWPRFFDQIQEDLKDGGQRFIDEQVQLRRKVEPVEDESEENSSDE